MAKPRFSNYATEWVNAFLEDNQYSIFDELDYLEFDYAENGNSLDEGDVWSIISDWTEDYLFSDSDNCPTLQEFAKWAFEDVDFRALSSVWFDKYQNYKSNQF